MNALVEETDKKIALVTGAASGIGEAKMKELLGRGYIVYATDIGDIKEDGFPKSENLRTFKGDITNPDHHQELFGRVQKDHGKLDALVNCAGVGYLDSELKEMSVDGKRTKGALMRAVNLDAPEAMVEKFSDLLQAAEDGNVVDLASYSGVNPGFTPFSRYYAELKREHILRVQRLAPSYADKFRMNLVSPGFLETGIADPGAFTVDGNPAWSAQVFGIIEKEDPTDQDYGVQMSTVLKATFMCINDKSLVGANVCPDGGLSFTNFKEASASKKFWMARAATTRFLKPVIGESGLSFMRSAFDSIGLNVFQQGIDAKKEEVREAKNAGTYDGIVINPPMFDENRPEPELELTV